MSPQPRGVVPDEHRERILAARAARDDAAEAYCQAVADALKAGASVREVSALTGLATQTVMEWGHARGWPTAEQRAVRAEQRRQIDEFQAAIDAANAVLRATGQDEPKSEE